MRHNAEIFDYVQYLFQTTGFNDHQLHCVIQFADKLDAVILEKAVYHLIKTVPVLSRKYKNYEGKSYWEDVDDKKWKHHFLVVDNAEDFETFTFSKTREGFAPQLRVCLFQADKDAVSIVMNHMVTDGAGFKQCLYLLSDIYNKLCKNSDDSIENMIDGDRSFRKVISDIKPADKMKILLLRNKDNNQRSNYKFPMSTNYNISPFIITHNIMPERCQKLQNYCKDNKVTVNDVLLAAYFRTLSSMLDIDGKVLGIPIMIDMRRYVEDKSLNAITNLTSMETVRIFIDRKEDFYHTLMRVNSEMNIKKADYLGMNSFLKLDTLFKVFRQKYGYKLLKIGLKSPNICMTNIGVLDESRLKFNNISIENAYVCGSIKYRPHFQMAVSTYCDIMTLSVNLYGSKEDQEKIEEFFDYIDQELNCI